jgi:hypothetical protein
MSQELKRAADAARLERVKIARRVALTYVAWVAVVIALGVLLGV